MSEGVVEASLRLRSGQAVMQNLPNLADKQDPKGTVSRPCSTLVHGNYSNGHRRKAPS